MVSTAINFRYLIITAAKSSLKLDVSTGFVPAIRLSSSKALSRNVSLMTSSINKCLEPQKKPVVLLYSWLLAKNKHLKHYTDLYEERGFDVLRVKVSPFDVLWPKFVCSTIEEVGNFLMGSAGQPILTHGFSVGGFVHMELLRHLFESPDQLASQEVLGRFRGQIFDSVVDVIGIAEGVSMAMFVDRPILRKMAHVSIDGYLKLMENNVTAVHRNASKIFHTNSLRTPSLMLYSKKDPIGSAGPIESAIENWKEKNIFVMSKCWTDTSHVGHFRSHRDEYVSAIDVFIKNIGLLSKEDVVGNIAVTQVPEKAIDMPAAKPEFEHPKRKIFASHKSGI